MEQKASICTDESASPTDLVPTHTDSPVAPRPCLTLTAAHIFTYAALHQVVRRLRLHGIHHCAVRVYLLHPGPCLGDRLGSGSRLRLWSQLQLWLQLGYSSLFLVRASAKFKVRVTAMVTVAATVTAIVRAMVGGRVTILILDVATGKAAVVVTVKAYIYSMPQGACLLDRCK